MKECEFSLYNNTKPINFLNKIDNFVICVLDISNFNMETSLI